MPSFDFKFQSILNVREKQQQAKEVALAQLDAQVAKVCETLNRWRIVRETTIEDQDKARLRGDLAMDARYGDYLTYVATRAAQCREELRTLSERREVVRADLERAMQARKALENYRDRLETEFIREADRVEEHPSATDSED